MNQGSSNFMVVNNAKTNTGTKHSSKTEPKTAPKSEAKNPPDNTAAKQAPKETKTAVDNSFGGLPKNADEKQPVTGSADGNDAKQPAPAGASKSPAPADSKAPADPKAAPANNAKTPEGKPGDAVKDAQNQPVKTPSGENVILDENKHPVASDPNTGKVVQDGSGNPYMVLPDGKYAATDSGNPVVYDKANANNPVAIDPKTGEAVKDAKGNIRAIGDDGNFIKTPQGNDVVYDKTLNKYNLMATGEDGNPLVIEGYPAAVGKDGNTLQSANKDPLVYDKRGNTVALGQDGKIITDAKGNALALDKDGKFLPDVVYDKLTGFRGKVVNGEVATNARGMVFAVDEDGKAITGPDGQPAVTDPRGVPVLPTNRATPSGFVIYTDVATGEMVGIENDYVFKIDPATFDLAKDANGNILPALYDPVNSDPTRPPVKPNENPAMTLKNLPQGKERGDPMKIKDELFDELGNLDVTKVHDAAAKYDARDIYDALINSGIHGGWNSMSLHLDEGDSVVHPNEAQAREAIAALIAWQNENGKYNPIKQGTVTPIIFYNGKDTSKGGFSYYKNAYVNVDAGFLANVAFHELNHSAASKGFHAAYSSDTKHIEVITEYLANNWTGNDNDTGYEAQYAHGINSLEHAIKKMGDGDYNKGMDILKRAYFAGDPVALEQLKKVFPPGEDFPGPDYSNYEGGEPNFQA